LCCGGAGLSQKKPTDLELVESAETMPTAR